MNSFLLIILTLFMSAPLVNADEKKPASESIQKKLEELEKAEKSIQKTPTLSEEEIMPSPQIQDEDTIINKEENKKTLRASKPKSCVGLSVQELTFAHSLDPARRRVFCTRFSSSQRKIAMNMVGSPDSKGVILTPETAFDLVARQHDIITPKTLQEEEALEETEKTTTP